MELSNGLNILNFCANNLSANSVQSRPNLSHNIVYASGLQNDCFVRKPSAVPYEVERLFPNDEFKKIYLDIANSYGLKNPPKIIWAPTGRGSDACNNAETNSVYFDIDKFSEKQFKAEIEYTDKNGNIIKGYQPSSTNILAIFKDEQEFDKDVRPDCDRLNIKAKLVPLTDDDKRKIIIFKFAHELGHAFQNQIVSQTEGMSLRDMLRDVRMKFDGNFLTRSRFLATWNNQFEKVYGKEEKLYSPDSKAGRFAQKVYDATLNYPHHNTGTREYYNNFLEIDANARARAYLNNKHNGFNNMVDLKDLRQYINDVS